MDDDYVAQLLAREARESSLKYSSQGLSALMPSKPAGNAPKPNTRFLRHLIKETDNHNTALKRKEERESRERIRQLKTQGSTASSSTDRKSDDRSEARGSRESRQDEKRYHYHSSGRRHKSRSVSTERDRSRRHRRGNEDHDEHHDRPRDRDERSREHRHGEYSKMDRRNRDKDYSRRRPDRSYSKSRSRSPRRDRSSDRHRRRRHDHHDESFSRRRSRSREVHKSRSKGDNATTKALFRSHREPTSRNDRPSPSTTTARNTDTGNESDPLEDLVGPLPPSQKDEMIRSRGRGAYKNLSNIDAHFAPGYDPATDIQLDDGNSNAAGQQSSRRPVAGLMTGEDDWDMALEALRDRTRWKQKGEERLREAGIDDTAIDRWKNNAAFKVLGGEGNPEDVQWSKKGEGREWDRGKFVDDEGHIDVRAAW
ncbi:hypothetical protein PENANT_c017G09770 [Penicillium antarcticum]|uniref:Pre-mRNA-splicing factor 38B n=1 Tax=Penicillium antarcticum TaxID=416450 RepID=A0A1V6Q3A3_9EURO|nr:uncharacterized protein N7508_005329 [Penicillium antarcticum]KAJ5306314.1 hypothetical protein N7508_005329 [Penicillium antarcticum]OQD83362.1 hypothetical protein PENANT_c017G09770 [Penicillium antarcticum]